MEKMECKNCFGSFSAGELIEIEGQHYCQECFDEVFGICAECGEAIPAGELTTIGDETICEYCIDENYYWCDSCQEYYHLQNDHVYECDWCGGPACPYCSVEDSHGTILCRSCYHESCLCDECNRFVPEDAAFFDDVDTCYCESCYEDHVCKIRSYNYKPDPVFWGDGPIYLGIELELDEGEDSDDCAREILLQHRDYVYCKHDGSLNRGFEIVSHPASLEYHLKKLGWEDIFSIARDHYFTSHDAGTCGLHVHINRTAFGSSWDAQELNIAKLLYLFEKFWQNILRFSRRTEEQADQWARRYGLREGEKVEDMLPKTEGAGRYRAINLENEKTIEIRIFRGTLRWTTFAATLQLVNLLIDIVSTTDVADIQSYTWQQLAAAAQKYPELGTYLAERGLTE